MQNVTFFVLGRPFAGQLLRIGTSPAPNGRHSKIKKQSSMVTVPSLCILH